MSVPTGIEEKNSTREVSIKVLRSLIDSQCKGVPAEAINLHNALDLIEYRTIEFENNVVRAGFNDFLGCFTNCPFESEQDKRDWATGYMMASQSTYVNNNKDHFTDCHFDDAKEIVENAINKNNSKLPATKEYALGELENGIAKGWHRMPTEGEAIKAACDRSLEHSTTQCIMLGYGEDDDDAQVVFLVIGGHFYKPHDL